MTETHAIPPPLLSRIRRFLATARARGLPEDVAIALVRLGQAAEGDGVTLPAISVGLSRRRPAVVGLLWTVGPRRLEVIVSGWADGVRRPHPCYAWETTATIGHEDRPVGAGVSGPGWIDELRTLLDWAHAGPAVASAGGIRGVDRRGWSDAR